jgi:exopolyphosphatase/guanosine-5'-triphosphate,3'-diphosphate pyrophosphatase
VFERRQWEEAYGSSGTVGAISDILRTQGWTDGTITSQGLLTLRYALLDAGEIKRIRLAGMKPDRQQVLVGGFAVLAAVFESLGIDEMRPARGGLRVGVLHDLLGRREQKDLRDASVTRMQARLGVDRAQAQRVNMLAAQFHAALKATTSEEAANRLRWAALLHEVGFAISHSDYHKHSAYLIEHSDLAGFSTSDQQRVASLVLAQRGNLKKVAAAVADRESAASILALRLAVIVLHARHAVELPAWSLKLGKAIELGLGADWLAHHPLTQYLLDEEAAHWERVGLSFTIRPV